MVLLLLLHADLLLVALELSFVLQLLLGWFVVSLMGDLFLFCLCMLLSATVLLLFMWVLPLLLGIASVCSLAGLLLPMSLFVLLLGLLLFWLRLLAVAAIIAVELHDANSLCSLRVVDVMEAYSALFCASYATASTVWNVAKTPVSALVGIGDFPCRRVGVASASSEVASSLPSLGSFRFLVVGFWVLALLHALLSRCCRML